MQQGLSRPGHDWWERWWGTRPQNKSDAELHNLRHICNLYFSMSSFVLWNTLPFFAETENPNLFWLGWFPLLRNTKRKAGSGSTRALRSPLAPLNWHSEEKWTLFSDHVAKLHFTGTERSNIINHWRNNQIEENMNLIEWSTLFDKIVDLDKKIDILTKISI